MAVLGRSRWSSRTIPKAQVEELEAVNNPEDASRRHAQGALRARALHRAGRLQRGPAEEVLPPRPGARGAPALRLLRHLRRAMKDGERRDRRAALHLRSGDARRSAPGRPQGQGHHPLGSARHAVDAEVRLYDRLFLEPESRRCRGGPRLQGRPEPGLARGPAGAQGGAEPGRRGAGQPLPVRAPGLLLRRLARLATRPAGAQSNRRPARYVGEDREEGRGATGLAPRSAQPPRQVVRC